jgi:chromosome partitioning protein
VEQKERPVTKIFSLCNQKGGVGKTTTAINLATAVALKNYKVLLIDLDPQGNATSGLGVDRAALDKTIYSVLTEELSIAEAAIQTNVSNLSLIPANVDLTGAEIELIDAVGREFVLREALKKIVPENGGKAYDFIFIDCPPSLGILTLNALVAANCLLIPLQCEYYALEGLGQLLNTYKLVKDRLNSGLEISGVVLTMADFRTNLTGEVIKEVKKYFGAKVFQTIIPRSVKLSEAPSFGKPALLYDASNRGSQCYLQLGEEFIAREAEPKNTDTVTETPAAEMPISH